MNQMIMKIQYVKTCGKQLKPCLGEICSFKCIFKMGENQLSKYLPQIVGKNIQKLNLNKVEGTK